MSFLFLMYIGDLCHVFKFCLLLLSADYTNSFIPDNDTDGLRWNKLALNVSKTH